ncbi:Nuclear LIM interactor-interacting factor [Spironucleus salmonicida]|uniref:Mitochondrial import inner membrane translocase subunit TIM50 n=1 Tax=Spironucleus salmonicida TaxID=348837 RepID=V6LWW1_9EUKA|nr:Nuclear LIM interactor-interacting factor [Spironucleus salmonicida]|eukprot:EST49137.1 Nuclear LIM interactor-interacting factor [Spironucleus salmonicida]
MKCLAKKQKIQKPFSVQSNIIGTEAVVITLLNNENTQNIIFDQASNQQMLIRSPIPQENIQSNTAYLLPYSQRKTIVLDLDETLIHSEFDFTNNVDKIVKIMINNDTADLQVDFNLNYIPIYLQIRTGAADFIQTLSEYYDVILWTASPKSYADALMQEIDKRQLVKYRLYRNDCSITDRGMLYKDLSRLGRNLENVAIVDNSRQSFAKHPDNGILIQDFYGKQDNLLFELGKELVRIQKFNNLIDNIPKKWGDV